MDWPVGWKKESRPERSRFSSRLSVGAAIQALRGELRLLGAETVELSTDLPLKRNGFPYSSAREPEDSAVAVYFRLNGQPMVFACSSWDRVAHNIWAIAKHIGALRGMDRWGVGTAEQAFRGYAALPSAERDAWWEVLELDPHQINTEGDIRDAFRRLSKERHPDGGGSDEAMAKLMEARTAALKSLSGNSEEG